MKSVPTTYQKIRVFTVGSFTNRTTPLKHLSKPGVNSRGPEMTTQLTRRANMLLDNTSDKFAVTYKNGAFELMHELKLSGILKDRNPKDMHGYVDIEQCWHVENSFNAPTNPLTSSPVVLNDVTNRTASSPSATSICAGNKFCGHS
ncbi:hypothetical protein BCF53_11258 [Reinekea marinisedimentorum]|uniref:Uncharacterized protein n=1 Tax=Reinekea marinisedimentorum TaxID=230495 RepID=A0A4R3I3Y6_9GAMM|nr:hypothetical protein BCF53_11258 [Reinekea marinisedimentorum]